MSAKTFPGSSGFAGKEEQDIDLIRRDYFAAVGAVASVLAASPQYRNLLLGDLMKLVMEPLARGRLFIAWPSSGERRKALPGGIAGIVFTACVSTPVDYKMRRLIEQGQFPILLEPSEWISGNIHWILDVLAPDAGSAVSLVDKYQHTVNSQTLRIHPHLIGKLGLEQLSSIGLAQVAKGQLN